MPASRRSSVSASSIAAASWSVPAPRRSSSSAMRLGLVEDAAVAPEALGRVQRAVGGAHQVGRGLHLGRRGGHADRGRDRQPGSRRTPRAGCGAGARRRPGRRRRRCAGGRRRTPRRRAASGCRRRACCARSTDGEAAQHRVAGLVVEGVVDALEVVEVADEQRHRPLAAGVLDPLLEVAAVAQAGERVVLGEVAHVGEVARRLDRGGGLVGEGAQRLEALGGGEEVVGRVVDPDRADRRAVAVLQRHDQPVPAPRERAVAVGGRGVERLEVLGDQLVRAVAVEQHAALDLVRGVQERGHLRQRRVREAGDVGVAPAHPRARHQHVGRRPRRASRRSCRSPGRRGSPRTPRPARPRRAARPVRPGGDAQQVLDRERGGGWSPRPPGRARSPARRGRRRRASTSSSAPAGRRPDSGSSSESTPSSASSSPRSGTNSAVLGMPGLGSGRRRWSPGPR